MSEAGGDLSSLAVGQTRRQSRLGSEALYRIRECNGPLVEVEVVRAPGLSEGQRFRLTREAVLEMELIDSPA
jgi:hypothetical protein